MRNTELARSLGVSETVVRRMLNPKHDTKPEKIRAALRALGKRIVSELRGCGVREGGFAQGDMVREVYAPACLRRYSTSAALPAHSSTRWHSSAPGGAFR